MLIGCSHVHRHRDPAGCRLHAAEAELADLARGLLGRASVGAYANGKLASTRAGAEQSCSACPGSPGCGWRHGDPWGIGHLGDAMGNRRPPRHIGPGTGRPHQAHRSRGRRHTAHCVRGSANRRLPARPPDWPRRSCTRSPRQRSMPSPATSRQISPGRSPRPMQDATRCCQRPCLKPNTVTVRPTDAELASCLPCQLVRRAVLLTLHRPHTPDGALEPYVRTLKPVLALAL